MRLRQRPDRHHRAAAAAHVDAVDILDRVAERRLGLHIHLPGAAEQIEVVDVEAAERRLQRVEDVADLDPQHLSLVAIDLEPDLRRIGRVGAEDAGKLGLLVGGDQKPAHDGGDIVGTLALQRFERVLEAAGTAEPEDRGQVERKHDRARNRPELRPQPRDDGVDALRGVGPLLVGFQPNDKESLVRCRDGIDEIEPDDRDDALHPGDRPDDVLDLRDELLGPAD